MTDDSVFRRMTNLEHLMVLAGWPGLPSYRRMLRERDPEPAMMIERAFVSSQSHSLARIAAAGRPKQSMPVESP